MGSGSPGIDVADAALCGGLPQIADNIRAQSPGSEDVLLTKGEARTALGQPGEAEVAFGQAPATNPTSVAANIGLGRLKLGTDPVAAEALFLQALKREPRNEVALNDLGIARDLQGRHTDAQTAYREALGISPVMSAAQVNLALSLAMSGDKVDAAPILSKDLPPDQAQQALAAFTSERPNPAAATTLLNAAPTPPATPPAIATPASPAPPARPIAPVAPPTMVTIASPAPSAAPPPAAPPTTVAIASPAQPAAAPPAPPPARAPPQASGVTQTASVQVRLAGPVKSKDASQVKWQRLSKEMSELGGRQAIVTEVHEHGRTEWRVRTGDFGHAGEANALCQQVRSTGTTCTLTQ